VAPSLKASSGTLNYRTACECFLEWADDRGLALKSTKPAHVAEFMQHALAVRGWKGSTLKNRLTILRAFFAWAVRQKHLKENPIEFKDLPRVHVQEPDKVPFTEEQFRRVLNVINANTLAPDYWYPACRIAWHTGLRISDVADLRWADVNLDDDVISRTPIKTRRLGKRVEIPIDPELRPVLLGLWNDPRRAQTVLPAMSYAYQNRRASLVMEFREICNGAALQRHSFHSFRHAFVSRLLNAGVDALIISSMTGQTLEVIQSYAHVSRDAQRTALDKARGTTAVEVLKEVAL
jgi:integrase